MANKSNTENKEMHLIIADEDLKRRAQQLLDNGMTESEIANKYLILPNEIDAINEMMKDLSTKYVQIVDIAGADAKRFFNMCRISLINIYNDPLLAKEYAAEIKRMHANLVAVDSSKNQRGRLKLIRNIIKDFEKQYNGQPMPEEELAIQAKEKYDIDGDELEDIINKMSRQGEILRPKKGHVKCI